MTKSFFKDEFINANLADIFGLLSRPIVQAKRVTPWKKGFRAKSTRDSPKFCVLLRKMIKLLLIYLYETQKFLNFSGVRKSFVDCEIGFPGIFKAHADCVVL